MDTLRRRTTFKFSEHAEDDDRILDEQGLLPSSSLLNPSPDLFTEQDEVIQDLREQNDRSKQQHFIFVRALVLLSAILCV